MKKILSFSKLPKWKQRVEIAKDVLKQLKLKTFFATQGAYINLYINTDEYIRDSQLNKLIETEQVTCNVCAKGALFISHVMKENHCTFDDARNASATIDIPRRLKMFPPSQLNLIETAFEKKVVFTNDDTLMNSGMETPLAEKAIKFCKSEDDTKIMTKIMKNIIKNKGTFKP